MKLEIAKDPTKATSNSSKLSKNQLKIKISKNNYFKNKSKPFLLKILKLYHSP